jgi:hypothetical protein
LWLGDFNWHHLIWEVEDNEHRFEVNDFISPLIDLLYKNEMLLALPKGIPTFQMAMGNWTCPDNVWRSNTPDNPITRCDVVSAIRPPLADHMPIITILDLPFPRLSANVSLDFRAAYWSKIHRALTQHLEEQSLVAHIRTEEEFNTKVNVVLRIIKEVFEEQLEERRPSPFKC